MTAAVCGKAHCTRVAKRRGLCGAHYESWRIRQHAYGRFESAYVDAAGVREHVLRLRATGLGTRRIAELAGVHRSSVCALLTGRSRTKVRQPALKIGRHVAAAILAIPTPSEAEVAGGVLVDSTGTVRRLQALIAGGYTLTWLGGQLGIAVSNMGHTMGGCPIRASTARRVTALYERISHLPGPSTRSRNRAQRRGWAPPLAWDDDTIDDLSVCPATGVKASIVLDPVLLDRIKALRVKHDSGRVDAGRPYVPRGTKSVRVRREERSLYVAQLRALGWAETHICLALGISHATGRAA